MIKLNINTVPKQDYYVLLETVELLPINELDIIEKKSIIKLDSDKHTLIKELNKFKEHSNFVFLKLFDICSWISTVLKRSVYIRDYHTEIEDSKIAILASTNYKDSVRVILELKKIKFLD